MLGLWMVTQITNFQATVYFVPAVWAGFFLGTSCHEMATNANNTQIEKSRKVIERVRVKDESAERGSEKCRWLSVCVWICVFCGCQSVAKL